MEAKQYMYYGPWSITQRPVWTSSCWTVNSCKAKKFDFLQKNIMVQTTSGDIILDCQIKTDHGFIARVEFLWETKSENAHVTKSSAQEQKGY